MLLASAPGWEHKVNLGTEFVARSVADVSELLRDVGWGRSDWCEVCRLLEKVLPGSAPSIASYDLSRPAVRSAFYSGMDEAFVASYVAHYVKVNPWIEYWAGVPSGTVAISERESPSSAFAGTEFWTDWLSRQDNMAAAVGTRLDVTARNIVHVAWHYNAASAVRYDPVGAEILAGIQPALFEATNVARQLSERLESGLPFSSLLERIDGAAMLVTRNRCIREANERAEAALSGNTVLSASGKRLVVRDPAAQRWFEERIERLADGDSTAHGTTTLRVGDDVFSLTVASAPQYASSNYALLIRPPTLVLAVIRRLAGGRIIVDDASLRRAYGLSSAELRLCEILLNGSSLAEAAEILGVSEGTIRQRVKLIFQKTRTHRQGELIARLAGFATNGWPKADPERPPIWE